MKKSIFLILFLLSNLLAYGKSEKTLVLFSKYRGDINSKSFINGFTKTMGPENSYKKLYLNYFNINKDNNNSYDYIKSELEDNKHKIIVAYQNRALEFVIKNRERYFKDKTVLYAGITNESLLKKVEKHQNFYGIKHEIKLYENVRLALVLDNKIKNLVVITPPSKIMSKIIQYNLDNELSKYKDISATYYPYNSSKLMAALNGLTGKDMIILAGDSDNYFNETIKDLASSHIYYERIFAMDISRPIITLGYYGLSEKNVIGGYVASPYLIGENLGELAKLLIDNKKIKKVHSDRFPIYSFIMNNRESDKFKLDLDKLPADTIYLYQSDFIKNYKKIAIFLGLFLLLLAIFLGILIKQLIVNNKQLNKNKKLVKVIKHQKKSLVQVNNKFKTAYIDFANKMATLAEAHDNETGTHIFRVSGISRIIANELKLEKEFIEEISNFAPLHDIGKMFVPMEIIMKPDTLDNHEWEIMKSHTHMVDKVLKDDKYFLTAYNIAYYHHEKYDGSGYPKGLKGEEIPIEAAIVAIADVYDALRSKRPYKESYSHERAFDVIVNGDGRTEPDHFHPEILEAFILNSYRIADLWDDLYKQEAEAEKI